MVGGEIFLSAFLQVLFDRLTPHAHNLWNLARREGLEEKLQGLEDLFQGINAVLADAEKKQLTDEFVKRWLDKLRDLAYDAEDVLDEFATEALRQEVYAKQKASSSSKLTKLVPARFRPSFPSRKLNIGSEIDAIVSRLEKISKQKDQLCLVENVSRSSIGSWQPIPTTSKPIEAVIYGRGEDRAKIIDFLLTNEGNCGVIPIVGMGGAGKTTLIQHVYEDEVVKEAFNKKVWICVSDDFDLMRIMKAALEDITSKPCELKEMQSIRAEFERAVSGERFLIILDDMWDYNFNNDKWSHLMSFLRAGASGSKVIITTRHTDVASKVGTIAPYMLNLLSNDDCWLLFKTHAFKMRDVDMHPKMHEKILERCNGLPLAARTLGGLLCSKPRVDWQDILDSHMWSAYEEKGSVIPVLRLSYHYLPSELKKCFAYCAIFPQDYEFTEKELTLLWVAEGLVQPTRVIKNVNEVGSMYFQELVSRSIFQVSSNHDSQFIMHDLVHELAQQVAGDTCLRLKGMLEHGEGVLKARHISYQQREYNGMKGFESFHKAKHVRTFFSFSSAANFRGSYLAKNVIHQLLMFKKLRVLSLSGYHIFEFPDSFGDLKHMRYLDLSNNDMIIYLPESICSLYNLEVLCLEDCPYLRKLPSKMENLINLCYLDITNCYELKEMPNGLKELKSLQNLSSFCVSKGDGCRVRELKNFKDLRGTLSISNLKDIIDANDAKDANLNEKKLDALKLQWGPSDGGIRNADFKKVILDMLQPHQYLKELTIKQYTGNVFSKWLGVSSFSNMTLLKLESCKRCTCLPPLGQLPSLEVLKISRMKGVENVGAEFYGSTTLNVFPSLKSLSFYNMQGWTNWTAFKVTDLRVKVFPCLSELSLQDCPKLLGRLPDHLPSLKKLIIDRCKVLNDISSTTFPELFELNISNCEGLAGAGTVKLNKVVYLSICGDGCEELITKNLPRTIEDLSLRSCSIIEGLPISLCNLKHLKKISIDGCSNLVSLPAALLFSSVIEELSLKTCDKLQHLVNEVEESSNSNNLSTSVMKKLYIYSCPKLEFVAKTLPSSLKTLEIKSCGGLKFVAEAFIENMELESIYVYDCENFQWLADGLNSLSHLAELKIWNCENLAELPNGISNLTSLTYLNITKCPRVINFVPEEGFMANLINLDLGGEKNLKALMEWESFDRLTSLKTLKLWGEDDCEIEEMMMINLPTSLSCLRIDGFPMLKILPRFPNSLTYLYINGFPMLKILPSFPISLTELIIRNCPNVEYLSSSSSSNRFQALTSLQVLYIWDCPKLKCLPKEGLPPSLCRLCICECPLLKCLPKEGMPPSLDYLRISGCPLLKKRCKTNKGKDWPKIANIPCVQINYRLIYETSYSTHLLPDYWSN